MRPPLRLLIVEDSRNDATLLLAALRRGPWDVSHERVETAADLSAALARGPWDLVVSDYSLPQFDGPAALALARAADPDVPFILVSGAVGEDTAVQRAQGRRERLPVQGSPRAAGAGRGA